MVEGMAGVSAVGCAARVPSRRRVRLASGRVPRRVAAKGDAGAPSTSPVNSSASFVGDRAGVNSVAYQGMPGAYSEGASLLAFPGATMDPCESFEGVFETVEQWMADRGVVPIENSLGGSIHRNYDLLLRHKLHIVGEVEFPVRHCLLAVPGVGKGQLERIKSHPQAIDQCEGYIRRLSAANGGRTIGESWYDTAGAAKDLADSGATNEGAIASALAAQIYGLEILEENIQDVKNNFTRFLVIARDPCSAAAAERGRTHAGIKTSIVFSLLPGSGQLFKALSVFALRDINMTKIESRPLKIPVTELVGSSAADGGTASVKAGGFKKMSDERFDYLFYVDFDASMQEENAQNALRHLQEIAPYMRVLGSYPKHRADLSAFDPA